MSREILIGSQEMETDVLVMGGGGTGLAAAVSAAEEGAEVIVAEKCSALGGTTALSIGSITACGTSYQARQGIADSQEDFFEDIKIYNAQLDVYDNKELCRILVRESGRTIEWMRKLGFEFFGPSPEPPHRVSRMHNVIPNAWAFPFLLHRAASKKGARFLLNVKGLSLIQEGSGISGALLEHAEKKSIIKVRTRRGVILACGDYGGSDDLKKKYLPPEIAAAPPYNPRCQGEGHVMGMEAGARLVNMSVPRKPILRFVRAHKRLWHERLPSYPILVKLYAAGSSLLPKWIFTRLANQILTTRGAPDSGLYRAGAILVNKEGDRFANELKDPSVPLAQQPNAQAYVLFDGRLGRRFTAWPHFISTAAGIAHAYVQDYERDVPDIISKGDTLEKAAGIHPNKEKLVETVRRYNSFVEKGDDGDFHRQPLGEGILEPPFYVMGPLESHIGVTIGGVDINTSFEVLNETGKIIPGLFAAGRNGGGLILNGHGLNLAWAFTSGRLAGKAAAQNL